MKKAVTSVVKARVTGIKRVGAKRGSSKQRSRVLAVLAVLPVDGELQVVEIPGSRRLAAALARWR